MSRFCPIPEQPDNNLTIYALDATDKALPLPFYSCVQAGFPSPADDYVELSLDLLKYLVDKPHATFCVRVRGNSMEGAAILDGSLLVVDRSKPVKNNNIIIAVLNGEFTVKRYKLENGQTWLIPEHPAYEATLVTDEMDFQVWGVVAHIITQPK